MPEEVKEEEVFAYLNAVRRTGSINMFGAAPYIEEEFDVSKAEARALLMKWMKQKPNENKKETL